MRNRRGRFLSILAASLVLGGAAACSAASAGVTLAAATAKPASAGPSAPAGWKTVFSDAFNGKAGQAPSSANWFWSVGAGFDPGSVNSVVDSTRNAYLDGNGHLILKAIRTSSGAWQSARLQSTRDDFKAPAGGELELTASIKLPLASGNLGYWPAFTALGAPMRTGGTWPAAGELDMMESVDGYDSASSTFHYLEGGNAVFTGTGLIRCHASRCLSGYHTYSVILNRTNTSKEFLQFVIDGKVDLTVTEAKIGVTSWQKAIDHGFFLIFDLAIGGHYPDVECDCYTPTSATTSGETMSVAYAAAYEKGGNSTPPGKAIATGRLTGLKGLCLDNQNSRDVQTNPIYLTACHPKVGGEVWSVYSDGTLRVQGGCLDDAAGSTTSGSWLDWFPCTGTGQQIWTRKANGEVVNPRTGLCLADPLASTSSRIVIENCTGGAEQRWNYPR